MKTTDENIVESEHSNFAWAKPIIICTWCAMLIFLVKTAHPYVDKIADPFWKAYFQEVLRSPCWGFIIANLYMAHLDPRHYGMALPTNFWIRMFLIISTIGTFAAAVIGRIFG